MSLFKGTTKKINRNTLASTVPYLFNTNKIGELKADSNDSIFYYTKNQFNDHEASVEYKVDETKATIDALWPGYDVPITLSVLKKETEFGLKDYVSTITVNTSQVGFGWADPSDSSKSWIEIYPSAFKKVTYQVALSLDQLSGVANVISYKFLDSLNAAFTGGDRTGTINYSTNAIAISVPNGTVVTALVPTFVLSTGASAKISTVAQTSGITTVNLSSAKQYDITAANGTVRSFTVTCTVL